MRSQQSALAASVVLRGSMTISLAPRLRARVDAHGLGRRSCRWVDAPDEHALSIVEVGQRYAAAIGVFGADAAVPGADVIRGEQIRTAESIGQSLHPAVEVDGGAAGGRCARKHHGFGAVVVFDVIEAQRSETERLLPSDLHPAGIGVAFGAGAQQGPKQTVRRVDDLRRGGAFDANAAVGMIGIGIDLREPAVFDRRDDAAARRAHGAVGVKLFGGDGDPQFRKTGNSPQRAQSSQSRSVGTGPVRNGEFGRKERKGHKKNLPEQLPDHLVHFDFALAQIDVGHE